MREQHRLDIPTSACRTIFLKAAARAQQLQHQMQQALEQATNRPREESAAVDDLIAEADGVMVPIVDTQGAPEKTAFASDRRGHRVVCWKEAKTAAIGRVSTGQWHYAASFGDGESLLKGSSLAAAAAEYQAGCEVQVIADGALWIQEWAEGVFGTDAHQTVDLYHLLEYAAAAGQEMETRSTSSEETLCEMCRSGRAEEAAAELKRSLHYDANRPESAVFKFVRYVENRPGQFDYPRLRERKMPVGSGKIESTNRQLIQKRLKLPGAWWLPRSVGLALHLLVTWYNPQWDSLWTASPQLAA